MTETPDKKSGSSVGKCNKKTENACTRPACKSVCERKEPKPKEPEKPLGLCDRRDVKLKEAEKTIANKDVIIKMLQGHVKKMEEAYKHNLKETEDFRYKFCLAAEQVKRLRGACPKNKREKEIKDLKGDLAQWKQQCDQLMSSKERCSFASGKCSYLQQIKQVEKFMKSHYDLLQTLVEKISEKNNSCIPRTPPTVVETESIEAAKKEYAEQILKLQDEVDRLKGENLKLQDQIAIPKDDPFLPKVKDSVLETYRRTNLQLEKKISCLIEKGASALLLQDEEDEDEELSEGSHRKISFSTHNISIDSPRRGSGSQNEDENVIEREQSIIEADLQPSAEETPKKSGSREHRYVDKAGKSLPKVSINVEKWNEASKTESQDAQVQVTETVTTGKVLSTIIEEKASENGMVTKNQSGSDQVNVIKDPLADKDTISYATTDQNFQDFRISPEISKSSIQASNDQNMNNVEKTVDEPRGSGVNSVKNASSERTKDAGCYCNFPNPEQPQPADERKVSEANGVQNTNNVEKPESKQTQNAGCYCNFPDREQPQPSVDEPRASEVNRNSVQKEERKESLDEGCVSTSSKCKKPQPVDELRPSKVSILKNTSSVRIQEQKESLDAESACSSSNSEQPQVVDEPRPSKVNSAKKSSSVQIQERKESLVAGCACKPSDNEEPQPVDEPRGSKASSVKNTSSAQIQEQNESPIEECGCTVLNSEPLIAECGCIVLEPQLASSKELTTEQAVNGEPDLNEECICGPMEAKNEVIEMEDSRQNEVDEEVCICEPDEPENVVSVSEINDLNELTQKLNEIRDRVTELLMKQTETCKDLEVLKTEMTCSRHTTQACTQNICKLATTIDEQKETFLASFQEHKCVTDNLSRVNDRIQQELTELKCKIEMLSQSVNDLKNPSKEKSSVKPSDGENSFSDDLITMDECKEEIYRLSQEEASFKMNRIPPLDDDENKAASIKKSCAGKCKRRPSKQKSNNITQLKAQYEGLKKESTQKDKKIQCINALISYYKSASETSNVGSLKTPDKIQSEIDDHIKRCQCGDDEIHKYIEKVRGENLKLKTTISSVINHLKVKKDELKSTKEKKSKCGLCVKSAVTTEIPSSACPSTMSSFSSLFSECQPSGRKDLEIEDIYNVVRRSVAPKDQAQFNSSSTSCLCHNMSYVCECNNSWQPDKEGNLKENYSSVLCTRCSCTKSDPNFKPRQSLSMCAMCECGSGNKNKTVTPPKTAAKKQCAPASGVDLEEFKMSSDTCLSDTGNLASNLETYINYLHEQLNIISSIENRIEDLRDHIKTP